MTPLTPLARKLRRTSTDAERLVWQSLRARRLLGFKFRRQMPIGRHIVDFACEQARLVIELDGGQHADDDADRLRTASLEDSGFRVIRFWNHEVLNNLDGVLQDIASALQIASGR